MYKKLLFLALVYSLAKIQISVAQVVINEGCNKNYTSSTDEDGDNPDWIELYNAGSSPVNLSGYTLTDKLTQPLQWPLTGITLAPNQYKQIFCSGKDRYETAPFIPVVNDLNYTPFVGWNTHTFTTPYIWDGISNLVFNICSFQNTGYTENSVFKQTATAYASTTCAFNDGSPASCSATLGAAYNQRPNLKINGIQIGFGTIQNTPYDYPAPYGNWYWNARHQIMVRASELTAAGISAGPINSLGFEVVSTNVVTYTYIDIAVNSTSLTDLSAGTFIPMSGNLNHTNFTISNSGESIYLYNPSSVNISSLFVKSPQTDISNGLSPDASSTIKWMSPTPAATNNAATVYIDTLKSPLFNVPTGIVPSSFYLKMTNPNTAPILTKIVYTTDGSEPTIASTPFLNNDSILVSVNTVIRAKVFPLLVTNYLPSHDTYGTYLFNIDHTTPILLITTENSNLYGATGIFDNYNSDWVKPAHVTWLTKDAGHPTLFQTRTSIRMDGGAGGSRSNPQHSFRLTFNHASLGEKTIHQPLIPNVSFRNDYSEVYVRNGSNQWLTMPYKDATQVSMMSTGTKNYYSAMEPVTVYINGQYFGLYELREKFNTEYFDVRENIKTDSVEILSMSYFYNLVLRALEGKTENFYNDYNAFTALNPALPTYVTQANQYFDLTHYTDYIIGEAWMGNHDWPGNNIKIYRSNKTNYRWRFALIDLELSLAPNGWTVCTDNQINYMLTQNPANPYINIWLRSIQNLEYKNSFINRFADLMNTSYLPDTLLANEQSFYDKMLPEMPNEYARWGDPLNIPGQMLSFTANHTTFQQQLICRSDVVRDNLLTEFALNKKIQLSMDVFPDSASGSIKLNTIQPQHYPWSGIYFDGVPVTLTAIAKPGYMFVKWLPNSFIADTLISSFTSNVNLDSTTFTAVFKMIPPIPDGPNIHFSLYPSPSNSFITIEHDNMTIGKNVYYQIYDVTGRIIKKEKLDQASKKTTIDIYSLGIGLYFIKLSNDAEINETMRFVKQ